MSKTPRDPAIVRDNLERIARALNQPVTALFGEGGSALREAETLALVQAFDTIANPQSRAHCRGGSGNLHRGLSGISA